MAAMRGNIQARYNLGSNEGRKDNNVRAAKNFAIAARSWDDDALTTVREGMWSYWSWRNSMESSVYQAEKDSLKSEQRDNGMIEMAKHLHIGPV